MGAKPARKGKHLFLYLACLLMLGVWAQACTLLPRQWEGEAILSRAKTSMADGHYDLCFDKNSELLNRFPLTFGDQALLQMGILFAHPENPGRDYEKSIGYFQRLLREHPESKVRHEARVWTLLIQETAHKEKEIEELRDRMGRQTAAAEEEKRKAGVSEAALKESREKILSLTRQMTALQAQVEDLKNQIQELKRVDLGTEEKKRQSMP